jgi:hypothetical protein
MSYVIAAPEFMTAAATDLANIGKAIRAANAAAASPEQPAYHRRRRGL